VISVRVRAELGHTDFTVHGELICGSSEFFRNALSREWRESKERLVKLPSRQPKAFQLYVQWLYTGRLHLSPRSVEANSTTERTNIKEGYLLADYLQDTKYKDTLVDALRDWIKAASTVQRELMVVDLTHTMFSETPAEASMRTILVDVAVWCLDHMFWEIYQRILPEEFVRRAVKGLSIRYQSGIDVANPFKISTQPVDVCRHQSHGEKRCYKADKEEE
jgi:hypothetical protein